MAAGFSTDGAFSGFSVREMDATKAFYGDLLGLDVTEEGMGILRIGLSSDTFVIAYPKPHHQPATFTIMNFPVDDVDAAVDDLVSRGVAMKFYDGMPQDAKGIMKGNGPDIAWFLDPSGNVLAVVQSS